MTLPIQLSQYKEAITAHSHHPPGEDNYLRAFYSAASELLEDNNSRLYHLTTSVVKSRAITPLHFANLLFRTIQFVELFEVKNKLYPNTFSTKKIWLSQIEECIQNYHALIRKLMLTRSTTTTIYQRYASLKFIISTVTVTEPIVIADFGCGGNYGLPGIVNHELFYPIKDHTTNEVVNTALKKDILIKEGFAIDRENPYSDSIKQWRLACSFYPSELIKMSDIIKLEERLSHVQNITFLKEDLLTTNLQNIKAISHIKCNFVFIATLFYQLTVEEQEKILNEAKKILLPNGAIIVQDFAVKNITNPSTVLPISNWFKEPFSYRTFFASQGTNWNHLEILRWKDGRCKEVIEGSDFEALFTKI